MAMFGNLSDMPPKEVFALLGRRSGRLHFQLSHGNSAEVHLHEGVLWSFKLNGRAAHEDGTLEVGLTDLLKQNEGEFDFSDAPSEDLEHHINITYSALLQIAARAEDDEENASEEVSESVSINASQHIPDKDTRFTLEVEEDDSLTPSLADFTEKHKHLLKGGASAADIAEARGVSLTRVQIYLSRLRAHGTIKPVRAYQAQQTARSTSPEPTASRNDVTRSDASRPAFAPPTVQTTQPSEAATRSHAESYTEPPARRGLIRRLLAAIAPGGSQ